MADEESRDRSQRVTFSVSRRALRWSSATAVLILVGLGAFALGHATSSPARHVSVKTSRASRSHPTTHTTTNSATSLPAPSTTAPPTPTTTTTQPSPVLPTVTIGSWTGREPSTIAFSADGGNIAGDLTWSIWNQTEAIGNGTRVEENCVPNCTQGTQTPYPVAITLSNPVDGQFTTLVEQTADGSGATQTYTAPDLGEGAS
jgi:hypothetical protein